MIAGDFLILWSNPFLKNLVASISITSITSLINRDAVKFCYKQVSPAAYSNRLNELLDNNF